MSTILSPYLASAWDQNGAPQQAAVAAIGAAFAIIPYCFARACKALTTDHSLQELKSISETLKTHSRLLAHLANQTGEAPPTRTPYQEQEAPSTAEEPAQPSNSAEPQAELETPPRTYRVPEPSQSSVGKWILGGCGIAFAVLLLFVFIGSDTDTEARAAYDIAHREVIASQDVIGLPKRLLVTHESGRRYKVEFEATYKTDRGSVERGVLICRVNLADGSVNLTHK